MKKISILITTKNRLKELSFTLSTLKDLFKNVVVEYLLMDDGSSDGTFEFVKKQYPNIKIFRNESSKGLIESRNYLLNNCSGVYAITIDDDAHFVSNNIVEIIQNHFEQNTNCAVIACKIFWGNELTINQISNSKVERVKGFVGCGHVWNMKAWKSIPNYPEWFIFYGEEEFAAYQLFLKNWEIHFLPELQVHHRVEVAKRKKQNDYVQRTRRSFRSGWYLNFMFCPWNLIPKKMIYTLWIQIRNKTLKGDLRATIGIFLAIVDVVLNLPKLWRNSNRFTTKQWQDFHKLEPTKIYS